MQNMGAAPADPTDEAPAPAEPANEGFENLVMLVSWYVLGREEKNAWCIYDTARSDRMQNALMWISL